MVGDLISEVHPSAWGEDNCVRFSTLFMNIIMLKHTIIEQLSTYDEDAADAFTVSNLFE